jgi:hypothetical protein
VGPQVFWAVVAAAVSELLEVGSPPSTRTCELETVP